MRFGATEKSSTSSFVMPSEVDDNAQDLHGGSGGWFAVRDSPERLRPYNNDGSQVVSKTAGGASSEIRGADCMAAYVPPHKRARLLHARDSHEAHTKRLPQGLTTV